MLIQVHTDSHIQGGDALNRQVQTEVEGTLSRFAEQTTRVEVHLHDTNGQKGGPNDIRCTVEARLAGMQPITVTKMGGSVEDALAQAVEAMESGLDSTLGKLGKVKGRTSFGGDQTI